MMIYQQTMLSSTIEPVSLSSHRSSLSSSFIERRKISSSSSSPSSSSSQEQESQDQQDVRSVNFSSCTKKQEAQEKKAGVGGVKRMNSSSSVPIPECLFRRTPSELQLTVDEQVADQRDFAFFARLVSGISERRAASTSTSATNATTETDRCLTHIIQTRHHQQSHDDQEVEAAHCAGILIEDDYSLNQVEGEGVFYLGEDNDYFTASSSSSSSSSSLYQHEFVDYEDEAQKATHSNNDDNDDLYNEGGDCECMFDLEL